MLDFLAPADGTAGETKSKVELPMDSWFPNVPWAGTLTLGLDVEAEREDGKLKGAFGVSGAYRVSTRSTLGATAETTGNALGWLAGKTVGLANETAGDYSKRAVQGAGWLAGQAADYGTWGVGRMFSWGGWAAGKMVGSTPVLSQAAKASELYGQTLTGDVVAKAVGKLGFGVEATAPDSKQVMRAVSYAIYKELKSTIKPIPTVADYAWGGGGAGGGAETWAGETERDTFQGQGAEASVKKYVGLEVGRESEEKEGGTGGKLEVKGKGGRKSEYKAAGGAMTSEAGWAAELEVEGKTGLAELGMKFGLERDAGGDTKWEAEGKGELSFGGTDWTWAKRIEDLFRAIGTLKRLRNTVRASASIKAALGEAAAEALASHMGDAIDQWASVRASLTETCATSGLEPGRAMTVKLAYKSESKKLEITLGSLHSATVKAGVDGIASAESATKRGKTAVKIEKTLGGAAPPTATAPTGAASTTSTGTP